MRISENQIYATATENLNESLDRLMKLNNQSSSQRRLLLPSDNPAGMATVLGLSAHNGALDHFIDNVTTAQGWLKLADNTLGEVSNTVKKIKELAQQASTETYTREQRMDIARQMRELLGTLVNQSNTRFAGKAIFAGHKVERTPFRQILGATVLGGVLDDSAVESVRGSAPRTVRVEFTQSGTVGGGTPLTYRYSSDGGESWKTGTLAAGSRELDFGTGRMTLGNGIIVAAVSGDTGTRINVRPAVEYSGDDSDGVTVRNLSSTLLNTSTQGNFTSNVNVRIDSSGTLPGPVSYSYSLDNGSTWVEGQVASNAQLAVPGGTLTLASGAGNTFAAGNQYVIAPNTADISYSISRTQEVTVNNVGKDVFGGMYRKPGETVLTRAMSDQPDRNLFETVSELIGFVETNDTTGIGQSLVKLTKSHEHVMGANSRVGARVNLTDFVLNTLNLRKDNNTAYMANIESADVAELMSDVEKAKFIYSNVIKTNQIIMQLNMSSSF